VFTVAPAGRIAALVTSWTVLVCVAGRFAAAQEAQGGNHQIPDFSRAKALAQEIYTGHERTFYCDCPYKDKTVGLEGCGFVSRGNAKRAHRVEWDHVVPAENFGRSFVEWREGHPLCMRRGRPFHGRACAEKVSAEFRRMEGDLYNLAPAIGEVNAARSNYSPDELPGEARAFGGCDIKIADRKMEPPRAIRGDIARIYLYMDQAYPGRGIVGNKRRRLFEAWSKTDPVDAWECERARRIAKVQGNVNWVVEALCREAEAAAHKRAGP